MLTVYTLEKSAEWDRLVYSFAEYDTYWLSGYVNSFKIHGDGEPLLFYYDDGKTKGINVVFKRDISKSEHFEGRLPENTFFDFATPYGYGGWLIEGQETGELFKTYEAWCEKNNIVSEFVRFHPVIKNHYKAKDGYEIIPLGPTVVMDISTPEVIWQNITSTNRNMIRKAEKNGVTIHTGKSIELFKIFREIYDETMRKNEADEYYFFNEKFYESILTGLFDNFEIFYAEYEEKIIAASIMLLANKRMNYHLSGSVREYSRLAPTNLLLKAAAEWGSERGYKSLYLGGGVGSGEDSLFKFKRSFYRGEDLPIFYIGKKIFNQEKYNELVSLRENIKENGFFPKYRA